MNTLLPWQQPNNTEGTAWAFIQAQFEQAPGAYLPFPWASWIDAVDRELLPPAPPARADRRTPRATVCQHIRALEHLSIFEAAGITDLFWSHCITTEHHLPGLRLHPFPLFPVRCSDQPLNSQPLPAGQRPLLYSYIGFHQPVLYGRDTRLWILELPARDDALVTARREWHFEQQVYRQQVHGRLPDPLCLQERQQEGRDYALALQQSCFALCPSGAGPNSIRLWEALGFGAIPVILSDKLRLPGPMALWRRAALFIEEDQAAVEALPAQLQNMRCDPGRLAEMQAAGHQLWQRYGLPGFVGDVIDYLADGDRFLLAQARERLLMRSAGTGPGSEEQSLDLMTQNDPTELPLQVRRWLHSPGRASRLLLQLQDPRPLALQELRWGSAVRLCSDLLRPHAIAWELSSHSPDLEQLAAAGQGARG